MRLETFSVSNYRSITKAHRLRISDSTVLLGQNNEGKSNLLSALATAMTVVSQLADGRIVRGRVRFEYGLRVRNLYDWSRDFPIPMQESNPDGESVFRLEFSLTDTERAEFRASVGSILNESLPIEIKIGKTDPSFKVIKRGRGSGVLNKKTQEIAAFIGRRIEVTYIPAVRTAQAALDVVHRMVARELAKLESNEGYRTAFNEIARIQKPILDSVSNRIHTALRDFLPNVTSVSVSVAEDRRYSTMRRDVEVTVDDGIPTALSRKGDGVQSLAAISLLRGTHEADVALVLALEEPESHLHPGAIHRLREVLDQLSHQHQVVLTTHCPVFVDRVNAHTNIIVTGSKATPAKSISEVREVLGVRASDNLMHAYLVLVVEGESDRVAIQALAPVFSTKIASAMKNNTLAVEHIHGASKLKYKLSELGAALCNVHCLLDNDDSGRYAAESAISDGLLKPAEANFITCPGLKDSELEDLISPGIYEDWLTEKFGIDIHKSTFKTKRKWATRMSETFAAQGKAWNDRVAKEVKTAIAERVVASPASALITERSSSIRALFEALETRLARVGDRVA